MHFIYRRVRSGAVDAHPTEPAIVVNYELDAFVLGENGEPVIGDHKVGININYYILKIMFDLYTYYFLHNYNFMCYMNVTRRTIYCSLL